MLVRVVLVGVAAGIAPEPRGASSIGDSFVRIIIMYFRSVLWMPNGILLPLALNLACRRGVLVRNLWHDAAGGEFPPLVKAFYFISVYTYSYY